MITVKQITITPIIVSERISAYESDTRTEYKLSALVELRDNVKGTCFAREAAVNIPVNTTGDVAEIFDKVVAYVRGGEE